MFRRVIEGISKVFGTGQPISAKSTTTAAAKYQELQAEEEKEKKKAQIEAAASKSDGSPPPEKPKQSAEELCELRDGMTVEELKEHLGGLYRRHNRAASSLDEAKRDKADRMLEAIVEVRQRYIEKIID